MSIEDKEKFVDARIQAMRLMRASKRPNVSMEGVLQSIGFLQTFKRGGLRLRFKAFTSKWIATHVLGWTKDDITRSMEIGRDTAILDKELEIYYREKLGE